MSCRVLIMPADTIKHLGKCNDHATIILRENNNNDNKNFVYIIRVDSGILREIIVPILVLNSEAM